MRARVHGLDILRSTAILALFGGAVLAAGCGSGSGSGSSHDAQNSVTAAAPELANLSPGRLDFEVSTGDSVQSSFHFANSGTADLTWDVRTDDAFLAISGAASGRVAAGASAAVTVSATCSGSAESGAVVLRTNDADEAQVAIPVAVDCLAGPEYAIARVLLNQAARSFDSNRSGSLSIGTVAGRELLVRAFVTGSGPVPDASVVIRSDGATRTFPMRVPPSIGAAPASETSLGASHYAVVPGSALSVGATLEVVVDPEGSAVRYPQSAPLDLDVDSLERFEVTFVPVTHNGLTPSIEPDTYLEQTLQQMPVGELDVVVRTPYVFDGEFDLDRLLEEMADLRALDGSTRLYHGIIAPPPLGVQTAGLGYVGYPVSVSVDLGGTENIISHEVGHNLNLGHAPGCEAPNADADYPYADGGIATWGFDITRDALVAPTATLRDLMSYCGEVWVSDYHFRKALAYRVGNAQSLTTRAGVSVRGRIDGTGIGGVALLATTHVIAAHGGAATDHVFRAWDAHGALIVELPFGTYAVADTDVAARGFAFQVPVAMSGIHQIEIAGPQGVLVNEIVASDGSPRDVRIASMGPATLLDWPAQGYESLVVRNSAGDVIALDRGGEIRLPDVSGRITVELMRPGHDPVSTTFDTGRDLVWRIAP